MKNKIFILLIIFLHIGCTSIKRSNKQKKDLINTNIKSNSYEFKSDYVGYISIIDETVYELGKRYNISPYDIMRANSKNNTKIFAGEKIYIPFSYNDEEFSLPIGKGVKLEVSSPFGMRNHPVNGRFKMHSGIDLRMPLNSPIVAAKDGEVTMSHYYGDYGNCIEIEHHNGFKTLYAHLNSIKVSKGDRVKEGEIIGYAGRTGNSTGVHLHFEILKEGKYSNPIFYVKELKVNIVSDMVEMVLKKENK
jgi:murein DD-endopeptidase MepM/ murein hydrolase activator NlpD